MGIADKEDIITNLIVEGIKSAPNFKQVFFSNILEQPDKDYKDIEVYPRLSLAGLGVPDLSIVVRDSTSVSLFLVECKMKAEEGIAQTTRYASPELVKKLEEKLKLKTVGSTNYIFLTLFPDQSPHNLKFIRKSYKDLLPYLENKNDNDEPIIKKLLCDWLELVKSFYDRQDADIEDITIDYLSSETPLDEGYLIYKKIIEKIPLGNDLNVKEFFRTSQNGRNYYGALITKPEWCPSKMDINNPISFDPTKHFCLHFEPQFDTLNKKLTLFVHLEINPYHTKKWAKNNIEGDKLSKYNKFREDFKSDLKKKTSSISNFKFGGGSNQIGKFNHEFDHKGAKGVITELQKDITILEPILDEILKSKNRIE